MSNQPEQANQQSLTSEELRQHLLTQIEASKQAIEELNDEELEGVAGGGFLHFMKGVGRTVENVAVTGLEIGSSILMK